MGDLRKLVIDEPAKAKKGGLRSLVIDDEPVKKKEPTVSESPSPDGTLSLQTRSANPDLSVPVTQPPAPAAQPQAAEGVEEMPQIQKPTVDPSTITPYVPKPKQADYGGIVLPQAKVDLTKLPDKNKKEAAFKLSEVGNTEASEQILNTIEDDKDGYVYELRAYNQLRKGDASGAKQNLIQAIQLSPNNARLYPQLAEIAYKTGDLKVANESAETYINTVGTAGGDEEKAIGLAKAYAVKGDQAKSDYWNKTAGQIKEFKAQQGVVNTLKSLPDYLIHESVPGRLATGGFSTLGAGVDNIVNAIRGEEKNTEGQQVKLTPFERLVTGFVGLTEIGLGAGMYTPQSMALLSGVNPATKIGQMAKVAGEFTVAPAMLEFNAALIAAEQILPEDIYKWAASPVSSALEQSGIPVEQLSKLQQLGVQYGDMVGLIMASKVAKIAYKKTAGKVIDGLNGEPTDPVYVYWAQRAYEKLKNKEPLEPQEAKAVYQTIETLTPEDLAEMSTMIQVYDNARQTTEQLKKYQDEATEPTYRVNNELLKTPDEVIERVDELKKEGASPENIEVDIRNDVQGETKVTEALSQSPADKIRGMKKPVEPKTETTAEPVTTAELPPPPADMVIDRQGGVKKVEPKTEPTQPKTEPAAPEVKAETVTHTNKALSSVEETSKAFEDALKLDNDISDGLEDLFLRENGNYKLPFKKIGDALFFKEKGLTGKETKQQLIDKGINIEEYVTEWNQFLRNNEHKILSEYYHKAKSDGTNPELVKAVEELLPPTEAVKPSEVSTPKTTTNEKETQGQGRQVLTEPPAEKAPVESMAGAETTKPVTPAEVKANAGTSKKAKENATGAVITPRPNIKTDIQTAVNEVSQTPDIQSGKTRAGGYFRTKWGDLYGEDGSLVYDAKDNPIIAATESGNPELYKKQTKLEDSGYLEYDYSSDSYRLTPEGQKFVDAVDARLQTRRGVKDGTDLFPEMANIPEFKAKVKKLKENQNVSDETIKRITEQDPKELRQSATDIERKAESSKEAELVEAVRQADEIIADRNNVQLTIDNTEKASDDYYVNENGVFVKPSNAKKIEIEGYEGDFFIVKSEYGRYTIYEGRTGLGVSKKENAKTILEAKKEIKERETTHKLNQESLNSLINGLINNPKNGLSPRYKFSEEFKQADTVITEPVVEAGIGSKTPIKDEYKSRLEKIDTTPRTDTENISVGDYIVVPEERGKTSGVKGIVKKSGRTNVVIETLYGGWGESDAQLMDLTVKKADIKSYMKPVTPIQNITTATSIQDLQTRFKDKAGTPEYNKRMEELRKTATTPSKARALSEKIRSNKVDTNDLPGQVKKMGGFDNDKLWNDTMDFIADAIDAGATVAEAIQKGIDYIKDSEFYKGLAKIDQAKHIDAIANALGKIDASDTDLIKERKFFRNIQNATNISQETKDLLRTDVENRFYVVKKNNLSQQQAKDYIAEFGLDQTVKDLLSDNVEMQPDTRNFLSVEAMRQTDANGTQAMKSGDVAKAAEHFEAANAISEKMVKEATILGRAVQSYRTLGTPDRVAYNTRKAINKKRAELKEKTKEKSERKKADVSQKVKESIDETLGKEEIKKKISEAKKKSNQSSDQADPAETLAKRIVNRLQDSPKKFDPVREMVNVLFGKVNEGLEKKAAQKESTIEKLKRIIQNKDEYAQTWEDAKDKVKLIMEEKGFSEDMIEEYNRQLESFYQEIIGNPYDKATVSKAVNERGGKSIKYVIDKIEKGGYDARDFRDDIAERIIYETGASDSQAMLLADSIIKDVNSRMEAIRDGNKAKKEAADKRIAERQAELDKIRESKSNNRPVWGDRKKQAASSLIKKLTQNQDNVPTPVEEFARRLNNAMGARVKELGFANAESKKPKAIDVFVEVLKNRDRYNDVIEQARQKMREDFKDDQAELDLLDDYLGQIADKPFSDNMIDAVTREALAANNIDISELIRKHYTVYDATKRSLIDKLITDAGLSGSDAATLADAVSKSFDKAARRRVEGVVGRMVSRGTRPSSKRKSSTDELIEMVNMGAFSDQQFSEWYAKANGWPSLTPEQYVKLRDLANAVHTAPDGFQKYRATEDLMKFQREMEGISWGEIGQAFWYANVLSGIPTHMVNFLANTLNTTQLIGNASIRNPKQIPAMLVGLVNGFNRGWYDSGDALKTGYAPVKAGKLEIPTALELVNFKGGKLNPFNYAKFVRRAMVASDMIHYSANKEMREYQLAYQQAKRDGLSRVKLSDIHDRLFNTKQRLADAETKATTEGLKGRDYKRRVFELMEQSRPVEMIDDANNFAARATFNHAPEGTLGVLTDGINSIMDKVNISGVRPLKFLVPFTNIISNVANNAIDYTPWGFARAAKGGIGYKMFPKEKYREYTKEERIDELVKASVGVATMAALYALTSSDDGEEPLIEITANGTGDFRKNYELRETGWRPYSIKIGGKWVSYQYTPLSLAFAPIGFLRDREKYNGETLESEGIAAVFGNTIYNTWRFLADMSFLGTLNDVTSALSSDNPAAGVKMVESIVGKTIKTMVIPNFYNHAIKFYNEQFDIPVKETDGIVQQMYKDIPVVKNTLNDKLNALGEPVVLPTDRIWTDVKHEPIWDFIVKNKAFIGTPRRESVIIETPESRVINQDEYYNFIKVRGEYIKSNIVDLMKYSNELTQDEIKNAIDEIKREATVYAKDELFNK